MRDDPAENIVRTGADFRDRGLTGFVDAVLFLAILCFSAVALLAVALAAPLVIAVSAVLGALSALTARGGRRGGWRVANPA